MKKALSILFAVFYFLTTVGIEVNMHYCDGELESVALLVEADSCCSIEHTCSGCFNETLLIQNDVDEQLAQTSKISIQSPVAWLLTFFTPFESSSMELELQQWAVDDWEHPIGCPIYLSNCSLTYYG